MAINIRRPLKKLLPHIIKAREENISERDTVHRIVKVFEEVLGYDAMSEITHEQQIKDKFVDLAIKIDGVVRLLVEAKAADTDLRDRHIDQAQHYAAAGNIEWVVLTNAVQWSLYHLSFDEGIEYVRAFTVNLATDPFEKAADQLAYLHRDAITKRKLDEYWKQREALSSQSIGRALFTHETLRAIRREIRRKEDILIDEEDLAEAIHQMLCMEAREQIGPVKIRHGKPRKRAVEKETAAADSPSSTTAAATPASRVSDPTTETASAPGGSPEPTTPQRVADNESPVTSAANGTRGS